MYNEQTFWKHRFLQERDWRNIVFGLNNKYFMEQTNVLNYDQIIPVVTDWNLSHV